jgi:hypothetical protein
MEWMKILMGWLKGIGCTKYGYVVSMVSLDLGLLETTSLKLRLLTVDWYYEENHS